MALYAIERNLRVTFNQRRLFSFVSAQQRVWYWMLTHQKAQLGAQHSNSKVSTDMQLDINNRFV